MKMILLACICIGAFVLYSSTVGRAKDNYTYCLATAEAAKALSFDESCKTKKDIYVELRSCIVTVQKQGFIAGMVYGPLGIQNKATLLIETHNEECAADKVPLPGESLYL